MGSKLWNLEWGEEKMIKRIDGLRELQTTVRKFMEFLKWPNNLTPFQMNVPALAHPDVTHSI